MWTWERFHLYSGNGGSISALCEVSIQLDWVLHCNSSMHPWSHLCTDSSRDNLRALPLSQMWPVFRGVPLMLSCLLIKLHISHVTVTPVWEAAWCWCSLGLRDSEFPTCSRLISRSQLPDVKREIKLLWWLTKCAIKRCWELSWFSSTAVKKTMTTGNLGRKNLFGLLIQGHSPLKEGKAGIRGRNL